MYFYFYKQKLLQIVDSNQNEKFKCLPDTVCSKAASSRQYRILSQERLTHVNENLTEIYNKIIL